MKVLPIGTQSFKTLRENDYLYIDKTKYIRFNK
nr:AAA family ATPase [Methanobrevibacter curvatus]